ncbi:MAG TPA: PAS domain-containing sensor histidine kinase [Candidatus Sulfotelmatobacter sp.]|jgi:PAS domain S-box-containing protein|nr:PAS domain-containing sensor histidine kinase [Candidatus Sulfotelmatobacter sp.]
MFRLPQSPMRILGTYGAVSLVYFVAVDLVMELGLGNVSGKEYISVGLDAAFVIGSVLLLRGVLDNQYRRLRRVNEALEARYNSRTAELRAQISEKTLTEDILRASEQRFRDIAEASSDWLWETGPDLRFRYVSRRFADLTGCSPDLLLNKTPEQLFFPADPAQPSLTDGPMRARQPFHDMEVRLEAQGETRWVRLSGKPVTDAAGQFAGYRGAGSDITERRDLDAASAELRRRHELILNSLGEGVFGLDRDGCFTFVNPAAQELLGWPAVELIEKPARPMLAPDPADAFILSSRRGQPRQFQAALFRRKDGSPLPVEYVLTTVPDQDGGAVVAFRDVTEQKRAAAELVAAKERAEASTRAKSNFLAHISHQLRTPLNNIVGFADVMRNEYFGPIGNERYRDYVGDIGHSAAHLSDLIEDLVDLARIEAGKLELEEKPSDISLLAEEALSMVRAQATQNGCSLQNNVPGNLPPVQLDPRRFKQVLLNLLSNAVKFTPASGRIAIMAEMEPDGGLLVKVSDTGEGMNDETLDLVTRSFDPGSVSVRSEKAGAGLGLPLARQLMELHGGALSVASEPRQGTVVSLRIPPGRIGGV